jgi:hypothetical protein
MITERITLLVDKRKKKSLLKFLDDLDYVSVESDEDFLKKFIKNAPHKNRITEDEIMNEVYHVRYGKSRK